MSSRACSPGQCGKLGERGLDKSQVSEMLIAAETAAITDIATVGVPV
jgi:hypothetical protein